MTDFKERLHTEMFSYSPLPQHLSSTEHQLCKWSIQELNGQCSWILPKRHLFQKIDLYLLIVNLNRFKGVLFNGLNKVIQANEMKFRNETPNWTNEDSFSKVNYYVNLTWRRFSDRYISMSSWKLLRREESVTCETHADTSLLSLPGQWQIPRQVKQKNKKSVEGGS